jgi:hypothetical protein
MLPRPVAVKPLPGFRLWLRYADGAEGVVDLSDFAGRGVFSIWNDPQCYLAVSLGPGDAIHWTDEVELCPDALYLRLTNQQASDVFAPAAASVPNAGN